MARYYRFEKWILASVTLVILIYLLHLHNECLHSKLRADPSLVSISEIMGGELPQDDKRILNYIWENSLLQPPSEASYNLTNARENPSRGQGQFIQNMFRNMTGGFFIECGALDGETRSNSLWLERHLQWKGLLVEADPKNYALVKTKNRKAWTSNTCLATKPYPHKVQFMQSFNVGKIVAMQENPSYKGKKKPSVEVQCMPLYSLLSALNVTTVDYFSLDVEGFELQVLKTVLFDKVFIKTLSVEYIHTTEGRDSLLEYMESKGYEKVGIVRYPGGLANDYMFAHTSILKELTIP